jgi:sulfonate transport system ATP-binding protein
MAGLDAADSGTLDWGDGPTNAQSPHVHAPYVHAAHADVRLMFQEPRLLPWARVIDNVAVGVARLSFRTESVRMIRIRSKP